MKFDLRFADTLRGEFDEMRLIEQTNRRRIFS